MEVVLHVIHLRRGEVARSFRSSPFPMRADGRVRLSDVLRQGQPGDWMISVEPGHILEASKTLPVKTALEQPERAVINGVFAGKPDGWASMDAFYVVATPAAASRTPVAAGPGVAFAVPMPDH